MVAVDDGGAAGLPGVAADDGVGGDGDAVGVDVLGGHGVGEVHGRAPEDVAGGAGGVALDAADVELHPGAADVAGVELGDGEAGGDGLAGDVVGAVGGRGGDADAALGEGRGGGGGAEGEGQGEGCASGAGGALGAGGASGLLTGVRPEARRTVRRRGRGVRALRMAQRSWRAPRTGVAVCAAAAGRRGHGGGGVRHGGGVGAGAPVRRPFPNTLRFQAGRVRLLQHGEAYWRKSRFTSA